MLKYMLLRVALCHAESTLAFSSAARKGILKYTQLLCLEAAPNDMFTLSAYTVCSIQVNYGYKGNTSVVISSFEIQ